MRASLGGKHVSGAERLTEEEFLPRVLCELLRRPGEHDFLKITIDRVEEVIETEPLKVSSFNFGSVEEARRFAVSKLVEAGVPKEVALKGLRLLVQGANPKGGNMRGAVLMDIRSGERLENDPERGVRTVRMDWKERDRVRKFLLERGFTERTLDALAVATKNVLCGVLAELCWSDDPDYTTGYMASPKTGYVRIHPLKERGDELGGRIYFIESERLEEVVKCLERRAVLLRGLPSS